MGLVCDPVAGLVEEPCVIRNASCAAIATVAAELSLAGVKSVIPADEVIDAMDRVGSAMPESLRETAKGGIAVCPTALEISKRI
jgi:L-serine dehydratase